MNVLITGISGRIGSILAERLLRENYKVRGLMLPKDPKKQRLEQLGIECIEGRLEDPSSVQNILKGINIVFHLAAVMETPLNIVKKIDVFETNIKGTFNLFEEIILSKIKLKRFVFASSDEVYPSMLPKYLPVDENHINNPHAFYGVSKKVGEVLCKYYYSKFDIPIVIPRFTFSVRADELVSPKGVAGVFFYLKSYYNNLKLFKEQNFIPEFMTKKFKTNNDISAQIYILERLYKKYGDIHLICCNENGKPYELPFNDVRDVVEGLMLLVEKDNAIGNIFNFGPSVSTPFDVVVNYMSKKTGLPSVRANLPGFPYYYVQINISKARAILGFNPKIDVFKMIDDGLNLL